MMKETRKESSEIIWLHSALGFSKIIVLEF